MKTKKIKSNKMRMIHILDLIIFLICFFRCGFFFSFIVNTFNVFKEFNYGAQIVLLLTFYTIWLLFLVIILRNFLILAIYLAYRIPRVRSIKNNRKYEVIDNISYYRDRFKNITPCEISLLTDLEIEGKKDLSASILELYNRNIISFDKKKITINKYNEDELKESEKLLISMLQNRNINQYSISTWKSLCTHEAIEDNLIIEKTKMSRSFNIFKRMGVVARWGLILFISIAIGIIYTTTPHFKKIQTELKEYNEVASKYDKEEDIINILKTDDEYRELFYSIYRDGIPLAVIGTAVFVSIIALISMPIYLGARRVTYRLVDKKAKYDRTSEGKVLVEQIAGMKNFIHDFSNLSENEKESVKLWNDFLIYAVLLEENQKIVKDIFKYKNMDPEVLTYVNDSITIKEV